MQPGKDNLVGLDPNLALLAAGFLIYALFNAVFLPSFYKNGYKVGVAFVKATIPMALLMLVSIIMMEVDIKGIFGRRKGLQKQGKDQ